MYTVTSYKQTSIEKPSMWVFSTIEEFDIIIQYRYGIVIASVNDETLYKSKLTSDYTDSKISLQDLLIYIDKYFPEEMIDFSIIKKKINGSKKESTL